MTHPKIFSVFSAAFFFLVVIVNLVLEMNTYNENYFVNIRKPVLLFFIEFVAQIVRVIFLDFSFVELRTCSSTTEKDNFVLPEGRSELILQFF